MFVPQILNPYKLIGENRYGWLPNINDGNVMELIKELNNIIKNEVIANGDLYADSVRQEAFLNDDFVDNGHCSAKGAKKFANQVYKSIAKCS